METKFGIEVKRDGGRQAVVQYSTANVTIRTNSVAITARCELGEHCRCILGDQADCWNWIGEVVL